MWMRGPARFGPAGVLVMAVVVAVVMAKVQVMRAQYEVGATPHRVEEEADHHNAGQVVAALLEVLAVLEVSAVLEVEPLAQYLEHH